MIAVARKANLDVSAFTILTAFTRFTLHIVSDPVSGYRSERSNPPCTPWRNDAWSSRQNPDFPFGKCLRDCDRGLG